MRGDYVGLWPAACARGLGMVCLASFWDGFVVLMGCGRLG